MSIILLTMALAVNGGLFTGMIFHSLYRTLKHDKLLGYTKKIWQMPY